MSGPFIGRALELDVVEALLRRSHEGGAAIVVSGPPGIGKTSFLDQVEALAAAHGMPVVATAAQESEVSIPYAGLDLLVQPHLAGQRAAQPEATAILERSVIEQGRPGLGAIAMALVHFLEGLAADRPVLVRVDDVHWLDQPSFDALLFATRRLSDSPIVCVVGVRDTSTRRELAVRAGFVDLPIPVLDRSEARELLARNASWLGAGDARTVLEQAGGNPLAIVELPRAILRTSRSRLTSSRAPLTARLEDAFAERHAALPGPARDLLLVAASSDRDDLVETLAAVTRLPGWGDTRPEDALATAQEAGLVVVRDGRIVFEHPLVRSAIYQRAGVRDRQSAHGALAVVLDSEPARQVWHRASSTTDLDDDLAAALVETARNLRDAGDEATAFAALLQASRTARDPRRRAALSVDAMNEALGLGRTELVQEILATIDSELLDELDRNRLAWLREITRNGTFSGAVRATALAVIARRIADAGDKQRALDALHLHSLRMFFANPTLEDRLAVTEAAEYVAEDMTEDVRLVTVQALVTPIERAEVVAAHLERLRAMDVVGSSSLLFGLGMSATAVGDYPGAVPRLLGVAEDFRRQGRIGLLAQALAAAAWADVHLGPSLRAQTTADEAMRLAHELGQPLWEVTAQLACATVLGRRGEIGAAEALVTSAERVLHEHGAAPMLALSQYARATICMTAGRYGEAVDQLTRIFEPTDECFHLYYRSHVAADLIEAAAHSGRIDDITSHLDTLRDYQRRTASKLLTAGLVYGSPYLAEDDVEEHYRTAIDSLRSWPLLLARTQLGYGMWLRRHRRLPEARQRLRIAAGALQSLGAFALADRAREELRASGESRGVVSIVPWEALTAHELQIARLAADGFTNRQIGDRMLLSHRTVSTHLYKVFPKLGISSRGQLAAALNGAGADQDGSRTST